MHVVPNGFFSRPRVPGYSLRNVPPGAPTSHRVTLASSSGLSRILPRGGLEPRMSRRTQQDGVGQPRREVDCHTRQARKVNPGAHPRPFRPSLDAAALGLNLSWSASSPRPGLSDLRGPSSVVRGLLVERVRTRGAVRVLARRSSGCRLASSALAALTSFHAGMMNRNNKCYRCCRRYVRGPPLGPSTGER